MSRAPERSQPERGRRLIAVLALALLQLATPATGRAQPVRGRVLEGMSVRTRGMRWEIDVRFSVPIRVLRHTPTQRGSSLQIFVQPLQVGSADLQAFLHGESLLPPRAGELPLRELRYRGDAPGGPILELLFEREVEFDVRVGKDFRSVVIAVKGDEVGGYAVQLGSPPADGAVAPLPDLPALRGRRVYVATISQGGRSWQRLRVGFFRERSEAEAIAAQLESAYPGAHVVMVSHQEMRRSEASALPAARPQARRGEPEAPSEAPPDRFSDLMDEARRAMTEGEYSKAILIYTELLSQPEHPRSAEAQELLGLARERSGQLAHAKAEYEEYLRRYPEGAAAERVRQRLSALITARAPQRERLEEEPEPEPVSRPRFDTFGSAFLSYRRESLVLDDEVEDTLADSSLFTDLFVDSRLSGERYVGRVQLAGGYFYDFLDSGGNGIHLSSAFLEGRALAAGLTGSLGRRSESSGGVLGRMDGARVVKRFGERWETALVGGFPVDSATQDQVDTERYFVGTSIERERIFDLFDLQLFGLHQMVGDSIDRSAVGGELRYFQDGRSLFAFVDYDAYYTSLNIAQLSGNAQVTERGFVHLLADYRNSPILTTSNALQGQVVGSIGDLDELLTQDEIEALAEDRTATSLFLNLGGSFNARDDLQLSADFSTSRLSGTDSSGGVEGFDSTGFEYSYVTQLIGNGWLRAGDVEIASLRWFDGSAFDAAALTLSTRQPFSEYLRIEPRLLTEYRFRKDGFGDELLLRPELRFEYRRWKFDLDLEIGADWLQGEDDDELGWFGLVGIRFDY